MPTVHNFWKPVSELHRFAWFLFCLLTFIYLQYKYQLNIDGTVAAYRFPYLLAGNSVVFKQDSPFYEHFYKQLEPMKHYIPIKRDLSDLVEKIRWAIKNDKKVKDISKEAQRFVNENLLPADVLCYHVQLFRVNFIERVLFIKEANSFSFFIRNGAND